MNVTPSVHEKVKTLLAQRQKVSAVKLLHDTTGCSLQEAKDYVDHVAQTQHSTGMPAPNAANIDAQLKALLDRGDKLRAIKMYREYSGADLAASKDYVEQLEQRVVVSGRQPQGAIRPHMNTQIDQVMRQQAGAVRTNRGGGRLLLLVLVLLLLAALAWVLMRQH